MAYGELTTGQRRLLWGLGLAAAAIVCAVGAMFLELTGGPAAGRPRTLADIEGSWLIFPWAVLAGLVTLAVEWVRPMPLERRRGIAAGLWSAQAVGLATWLFLWGSDLLRGGLDDVGYWLGVVAYLLAAGALAVLWLPELEGRDALGIAPARGPRLVARSVHDRVRYASPRAYRAAADMLVYGQPSPLAPAVGTLRQDDPVQVLARVGTMLEVRWGEHELGYVEERFLVLTGAGRGTPRRPAAGSGDGPATRDTLVAPPTGEG